MGIGGRERSLSELSGRDWELWKPLLALARYFEAHGAEGLVTRLARFALDSYDRKRRSAGDTRDGAVLMALLDLSPVKPGYIEVRPRLVAETLRGAGGEWFPQTIRSALQRLDLEDSELRREAQGVIHTIARVRVEEAAMRRGINVDRAGSADV